MSKNKGRNRFSVDCKRVIKEEIGPSTLKTKNPSPDICGDHATKSEVRIYFKEECNPMINEEENIEEFERNSGPLNIMKEESIWEESEGGSTLLFKMKEESEADSSPLFNMEEEPRVKDEGNILYLKSEVLIEENYPREMESSYLMTEGQMPLNIKDDPLAISSHGDDHEELSSTMITEDNIKYVPLFEPLQHTLSGEDSNGYCDLSQFKFDTVSHQTSPAQRVSNSRTYSPSNNLKQNAKTKSSKLSYVCEEVFKCVFCYRKLASRSKLESHLLTHNGERPFACYYCDRKCSQKGDFKKHMLTHTREKPFECNHCDKRFSQKGDLKRHVFIHTGEKPFECEYCHVKFSRKSHMKTHQLMHTGEKPFECEQCNKKFSRRTRYNAHLLTHVPSIPS